MWFVSKCDVTSQLWIKYIVIKVVKRAQFEAWPLIYFQSVFLAIGKTKAKIKEHVQHILSM